MRNAVLILIWLALAPFCRARTITVDDDGPADFNNIQAAIDDANDGDTVVVADGTYTGEGNRDIDFNGLPITVCSENGPTNCIIDCNGSASEPHRGFYFHSWERNDSVLRGFTIAGGYQKYGGAIACYSSDPLITNCTITTNAADWGGGIYCDSSSPMISHCTISNNSAGSGSSYGGGIFSRAWGGDPKISNCVIVGNSAGFGGGFCIYADSSARISGCIITGNKAAKGGACYMYSFALTKITNCTISGNTAGYAGAIVSMKSAHTHIRNSIIWDNAGGDIYTACPFLKKGLVTANFSILQYDWQNDNCFTGYNNIVADPCFADPGHWEDPCNTPGNIMDDVWFNGDYHLKSQAGTWDLNGQTWVRDEVTSPCIDAGDSMSPVGHEPFPNGGIVNMGAYGGTVEASKSYFGEPVCEVIVVGDINGDCIVDFRDFLFIGLHWMEER